MPARIVILATAFACLLMPQPPRSFAAELQVDPSAMPRILPLGPEEALKSFTVKAGFHLEIAACEPLVVDPVTMCFDEQGRLFVVEMIDYSERREEDPHLGRVRMLTDSDGDGRYDQASVYADRLPWPTALVCYDGGVFIGATPDILWCRDNDGDGRADERKVVFTGFGAKASRLNVQALFNSFQWGLDNRIHGTCGTIDGTEVTRPDRPDIAPLRLNRVDFSFDPKRLDIRPETGGGQYGMSFDSAGRKFLCSNSDHAQTAMYEYRDSGRNPLFQLPSHRVSIAEEGRAAEVFRLSPDEPWRVIRTRWRISGVVRGVVEGGGRVSGYFTGASGLTVYQGDSYGPEFSDNLFIGDAGGNLVHRKLVDHSTLPPVARRPADERDREFIASRDNWFRPVHFANGPDGCLYIADMYRETIEHPWSLPEPIKQHLDLNSGNDRGRIYRVVKDGFEHPGRPDLGAKSDRELIRSLGSPNGWVRNTASRVLYQRAEAGIASVIKGEWESMPALGKVHALHLLSATGQLDGRDMARGLADTDERVRLNALRTISEEPLSSELRESVAAMSEDASRAVRYQLALTLSRIEMPDRSQILKRLLLRDGDNEWMRAVVFNAVRDDFAGLVSALGKTEAPSAIPLARMAGMSGKTKEIEALLKMIDSRWGESGVGAILTALDEGLKGRGDRLFKHLLGSPLAERFEKLKERLTDTGVPREERLEGIRKLSAAGYDFSGGALVGLLVAHSNAEIRQGVVTALLGMTEPGAFDAVLTQWSRLDPAIRRSVVRHALGNRT
ncbi:MAG: hypothetical protein ISQ14_15850, partial [Verrucomicrobiae bacterium]|nr:hypothetical protein [Verrucomicrobiae bacterium]